MWRRGRAERLRRCWGQCSFNRESENSRIRLRAKCHNIASSGTCETQTKRKVMCVKSWELCPSSSFKKIIFIYPTQREFGVSFAAFTALLFFLSFLLWFLIYLFLFIFSIIFCNCCVLLDRRDSFLFLRIICLASPGCFCSGLFTVLLSLVLFWGSVYEAVFMLELAEWKTGLYPCMHNGVKNFGQHRWLLLTSNQQRFKSWVRSVIHTFSWNICPFV